MKTRHDSVPLNYLNGPQIDGMNQKTPSHSAIKTNRIETESIPEESQKEWE